MSNQVEIKECEEKMMGVTRYQIVRADGSKLHPCSLEWCEHTVSLLGKIDDCAGGYIVATRAKKNQPWKKAGTVMGECLANAISRAWMTGLIPDHDNNSQLARIFHDSDWTRVQTRQHLKALKMKVK